SEGHHPGGQLHPGGARGRVSKERQRGGQAALGAVEVVLGHRDRVIASSLGALDLLQGEPVSLGGRRIVQQPGEEAELASGLRTGGHVSTSGSRSAPRSGIAVGSAWV